MRGFLPVLAVNINPNPNPNPTYYRGIMYSKEFTKYVKYRWYSGGKLFKSGGGGIMSSKKFTKYVKYRRYSGGKLFKSGKISLKRKFHILILSAVNRRY